jgi:hypothetical protein
MLQSFVELSVPVISPDLQICEPLFLDSSHDLERNNNFCYISGT